MSIFEVDWDATTEQRWEELQTSDSDEQDKPDLWDEEES